FAVKENVAVFLDESLKRFKTVYPAAGDAHSAVRLSLEELEKLAHPKEWIDVAKGWE
ncbi:MAG: YbaK/EbsC family protein, partial [Ligilactobacillus ruminis]|nr:YbaK/EbsC family protein [Ligilactobacillus ruminis]